MKDLEAAFVTEVENNGKQLYINKITRNNEIDTGLIAKYNSDIKGYQAKLKKETDPDRRVDWEIEIEVLNSNIDELKKNIKEREADLKEEKEAYETRKKEATLQAAIAK